MDRQNVVVGATGSRTTPARVPSREGVGDGWCSSAAEAVSRFPGPPLEDPPTSPPRNSTGARGGSAVGRLAHGLPLPRGRRSVAADVPACLAQRLQRSRPNNHAQRRLCGRRDTKRSDWRGGRAAASTSTYSAFSGPAPGLAGDRGGDLAGAAPSEAQRSDLQGGQFAKRASLTRSVRETGPAIPGHGKGPPRGDCQLCRPDRVASGLEARQGRDAGTPVARRAARQPGPAQRGDAQAHRDLDADGAATAPTARPATLPEPTSHDKFTSPGSFRMTPTRPGGRTP